MTDRICFVWRMMKIYNTPSETVFSIDCRLYKEWAITKNALHMVLLFLFNYVYRRYGRFPSFVWISYDTHFQNFSLGVFISVFCSLMSCLISKHEVLDIYIWIILIFIEFFCGELQDLFLPNDRFVYSDPNPILSLSSSYLSEFVSRLYDPRWEFDLYRISSSLSTSIYYLYIISYLPSYFSISSFLSSFLSYILIIQLLHIHLLTISTSFISYFIFL